MKRLLIILLSLSLLLTLTSCITYTIKNGLDNIHSHDEEDEKVTKYSEIIKIKEEAKAERERIEAEKKAEAQRKYDEEQALKLSLENLNSALEKQATLNPYPQDLSILKYPHIYRPINSQVKLDEKFTKLEVLFLNLGKDERNKECLALIAQNVSTIPLEFIFVTGSLENQVNFAKEIGKDAVTLKGGTIIFTTTLADANEENVTFNLSENKKLCATVIDVTNEGYKETLAMLDAEYSESKDFNLGVFAKLSKDNIESNKIEIEQALEGTGDTTLFAISQSEPATIDWNIFTPYSYRTDFEWPLSTYILEQGYRDTFEATRYSVEESAGITEEIGECIKERFDFLYSKGLMEVTSSTLAISGLTDTDNPTFAVKATYIMP